MQTNPMSSKSTNLGDAVAAAVDLGSAIAGERDTASKLAARRLERVLLRGSNARLALAIVDLAFELAPRSAAASALDRGRARARGLTALASQRKHHHVALAS